MNPTLHPSVAEQRKYKQQPASRKLGQYRVRGFWGGSFAGGLSGAFAAGQFSHGWAASPLHFLGAIVASAAVCALIGLLLAQLFVWGHATPADEPGEVEPDSADERTHGADSLHVDGGP